MSDQKITILADDVASQIAAGEVVERPASVVKELLENAIDAGATTIDIKVVEAGRREISVTDNGLGIPYDQLELAAARHATSKLRDADDLFQVKTLGFRGEALASIGSVARMEITSQAHDATAGGRLSVEAGVTSARRRLAANNGTAITVRELFYNVPARLKFLKTDMTEKKQIDTLVSRYAIAYPGIRFSLTQDGNRSFLTPGNGDRREAVSAIYGVDLAKQLLEVIFTDHDIRITGFISPTSITRANRREMNFFVNGRWIQDSSLSAAVNQAYQNMLMVGRYPLCFLFIELELSQVDVNVHPAKAEVRFNAPDRVFAALQRAVRRVLLAVTPVTELHAQHWQSPYLGQHRIDPAWDMAKDNRETSVPPDAQPSPWEAGDTTSPAPLTGMKMQLLRVVGQVGAAYLIAEGPDGLYLIDQHAAHERILFEKMLSSSAPEQAGQILLTPVTVDLPPQQARLLSGQLEALNDLGFQIVEFGPNSFQVRVIPAQLAGGDPAELVHVVVNDFEEDESPLAGSQRERLIGRICKRAAIKAGKVLDLREQAQLLADLETCENPRHCPHGRPTMIHLSVDMLERQFGRRGAR